MADDRVVETADSGPLKLKGDLAQSWREWRQLWNACEVNCRGPDRSEHALSRGHLHHVYRPLCPAYLPFANEADKQQMDTML